jgi:energy-coupling factor transport system permease protein
LPVSLGLAYTGRPRLRLDPRAKLIAFAAVNIVGLGAPFSGAGATARLIATALVVALLAGEGASLLAASALTATGAGLAAYAFATPNGWALLAGGLVNLLARFWPVVLLGCYVLSTTTVAEFLAALRRWHIPAALSIPFAVVMRFLPTLAHESRNIGEALSSRGLRLGGGRPGTWLEYRLVPLTMRAVAIGDELTAAALTRGLDRNIERTSLTRIDFRLLDWVVVSNAAAMLAVWVFLR